MESTNERNLANSVLAPFFKQLNIAEVYRRAFFYLQKDCVTWLPILNPARMRHPDH